MTLGWIGIEGFQIISFEMCNFKYLSFKFCSLEITPLLQRISNSSIVGVEWVVRVKKLCASFFWVSVFVIKYSFQNKELIMP